MKNTENYGLGKPELTEFYNVDVQNDNMDIIDAELKSHADSISNLFAAQGNTGTEISEINTRIDEVQEQAETATNIAKGRNQAHVFATTADMQTWLSNATNKGLWQKGDNIYIVELDVPDWWIAEVLDKVDADTGYYYKIAQLETQKVDLTNIEADIAENTAGVASINSALMSAGVNSWLLANNSIPSKLSFANLIVKGVVTFFTVTEDSNFPANYGSGVFIPMADKNVKYIYYMATDNMFYVGKVASGTVTWKNNTVDAYTKLRTYTDISQLGVSDRSSLQNLLNAMPDGSCFIENCQPWYDGGCTEVTNALYGYSKYGVLKAWRFNKWTCLIEITVDNGRNYFAYYDTVNSSAIVFHRNITSDNVNVYANSFIWAKTLTITFESVGDAGLQIFTQEGMLAFDYANGNFRSRGGSTLSKVVNYELKDDVLTITESAYNFTQTLNGNVLTITFDSSWACGIIMASRPFTLATSQ